MHATLDLSSPLWPAAHSVRAATLANPCHTVRGWPSRGVTCLAVVFVVLHPHA